MLSRKFRLENVKKSGPATAPGKCLWPRGRHRRLHGPECQGPPERRPTRSYTPSGFSTGRSGATPAPVQHPGARCLVPQTPEKRGSSPSPHSSLCPQLPLQVSTQRSTLTHTDEVYTQPHRSLHSPTEVYTPSHRTAGALAATSHKRNRHCVWASGVGTNTGG